ncbi:MAG: RidA family protein [Anaerolineales bacterium]|jgi:2-iminobutanoate/2-iminopropanoate deaminase
MSIPKAIFSDKAPKAIGPYSPAIKFENLVFTAGQIGLDPQRGEIVPGGVGAETRQALRNLSALLEAAGSSLPKVLKTTVFLKDMTEFGKMNEAYAEFFKDSPPARSTVQVAALPRGAAVEIECIAATEAPR